MKTKHMTILKSIALSSVLAVTIQSCSYLDVVPDNIPTIDHAFNNRHQAEGFLYGCMGFLPHFSNPASNPALLGGDEIWVIDPTTDVISNNLWYIARGNQGTNSPLADYWGSRQNSYDLNGGRPLFTALRDCNIFLENIHKPFDIEEYDRERWIAEVTFLKAYYHFWLLQMYGPIPLIKNNLDISSPASEVQQYREPVDSVVAYIVSLLDEAIPNLPLKIEDITNELGRPTQPVASAVKAQVLTLAASPLFNGNKDYASVRDNQGRELFSQTYDAHKWNKAAEACKEAIRVAKEAGHGLFDFHTTVYARNLSEETVAAMQVRGAVTERWNNEIIWGDPNSNTDLLQRASHPVFYANQNTGRIGKNYAPTLRIIEQFYSKNGVPIEEDTEWQGIQPMQRIQSDASHKYYIREGFETIQLHLNREPRFYGSIAFDGGTFYGNGRILDDNNMWVTQFKMGTPGGGNQPLERHSTTGYLCKKLVHYMTSVPNENANISTYRYAFPIIRLADLYLLYAETLNESKDIPDEEVYEYIDFVRARTGLNGVRESWSNHSIHPDKPLTKEGMREIIRRERLNELAFEGSRFWDLRRWKLAEEYLNKPIRGLNVVGENASDFYQETELFQLSFEKKDYLWPIRQHVLTRNKNLIQNPGW